MLTSNIYPKINFPLAKKKQNCMIQLIEISIPEGNYACKGFDSVKTC